MKNKSGRLDLIKKLLSDAVPQFMIGYVNSLKGKIEEKKCILFCVHGGIKILN